MRNDGPRLPGRQGGFWGAVAAGIGAATSLWGGKKARDAQKDADKRATALQSRQLDLAETQEGRAAELFDIYKENYLPAEIEMLREARNVPSAESQAASASADVRRSHASADAATRRAMRGMGVDPSSGSVAQQMRLSDYDRTRAEAGARTIARRSTRDERFGKLESATRTGRNLPTQSAYTAGQSLRSYGSLADAQVDRANAAARAGGEYGAALGSSVASFASELGKWWSNRTPSSATPSSGSSSDIDWEAMKG